MKYKEVYCDLFSLPTDNILVHCISSDFALGAGIAKTFAHRYGVKRRLYSSGQRLKWDGHGKCITLCATNDCPFVVANLITKERFYDKPTYDTLSEALEHFKKCLYISYDEDDEYKIGMPQIGCGLDKLDWNIVSELIKDIFKDTKADITVCVLERIKRNQ